MLPPVAHTSSSRSSRPPDASAMGDSMPLSGEGTALKDNSRLLANLDGEAPLCLLLLLVVASQRSRPPTWSWGCECAAMGNLLQRPSSSASMQLLSRCLCIDCSDIMLRQELPAEARPERFDPLPLRDRQPASSHDSPFVDCKLGEGLAA